MMGIYESFGCFVCVGARLSVGSAKLWCVSLGKAELAQRARDHEPDHLVNARFFSHHRTLITTSPGR
jgi:hypothetical protein